MSGPPKLLQSKLFELRVLAELGTNLETPMNSTPAFAAEQGHAELVRALAELGAKLDTPNNNGATPATSGHGTDGPRNAEQQGRHTHLDRGDRSGNKRG